MSRLIETGDGILIEVETEGYEQVSAGNTSKVKKGLEQIGPLLNKACDAMKDFWDNKGDGVDVEEVKVQFGLSFEASGNVYIAQAKAGASVSVTATMKKPA